MQQRRIASQALKQVRDIAQFLGAGSRSKWSKHLTKSPVLALLAIAGSQAAYKIISCA